MISKFEKFDFLRDCQCWQNNKYHCSVSVRFFRFSHYMDDHQFRHTIVATLRSLSVYSAKPGSFVLSGVTSAYHHDEPEPPGRKRSIDGGKRLSHKPKSRIGGSSSPWKNGPSYPASMAETSGNPTDSDWTNGRSCCQISAQVMIKWKF